MNGKQIRQQYLKLLPKLNKTINLVQDRLRDLAPHDFELEVNLKPYLSVKRKVNQDKVDNIDELSDLVRGRLYFSEFFTFEDVIKIIKELFKDNIKGIDKNREHAEFGLKYQGICHIDLNFDGINFELQIIPREFKPYKDFLHAIYEKFRNKKQYDKMEDGRKEFLKKFHNKLYQTLSERAEKNR